MLCVCVILCVALSVCDSVHCPRDWVRGLGSRRGAGPWLVLSFMSVGACGSLGPVGWARVGGRVRAWGLGSTVLFMLPAALIATERQRH